MITISSGGGRQLGKAYHEYLKARELHRRTANRNDRGAVIAAWHDFLDAAEVVAAEVIKDGHHEAEGD